MEGGREKEGRKESNLRLFVHSFIEQMFIKCLLCSLFYYYLK